MDIDLSTLPHRKAHDLFSSALIPRPIAWVSTISKKGRFNLAPFSFFTGVTWKPPTLCFSVVNRPDGTEKDTIVNIRETENFIVHIVTVDLAVRMVSTSKTLPPEVNEAEESAIPLEPGTAVSAPRVMEAKIAFECVLDRIVTVGSGITTGSLVLGTIQLMHVDKAVLTPDLTVDWEKLCVVGRLSGNKFCRVDSVFEINPE